MRHLLFPRNRSVTRRTPWYKRNPERFALEQQIVREHFSPLTIRVDEERELVLIEGPVVFDFDAGTDGTTVRVTLARNHPEAAPIAEDVDARFPKTAQFHQYSDAKTECLWFDVESPWTGGEDALRLYLAQLVLHIHRQLICEADPARRWPGPERPHTPSSAYREIFTERFPDPDLAGNVSRRWTSGVRTGRNEPCVCGSGRKFKRCHREDIESFERQCGIAALREAFKPVANADGGAA